MTPSPIRYFWTVAGPPKAAFVFSALLLAYAVYTASTRPREFEEVQALALAGQALAASTGYRDRLLRGHFDPILAGRRSRLGVALAHAAVSIAPGLVYWAVIGLIEQTTHTRHPLGFSPGALLAITYVSVVVWAVSLILGRNTGGVLWMAILFALASAGQVHRLSQAYGTFSADLTVSIAAARAAMVWPALLFTEAGHVDAMVFAIVLLGTLGVLAAGLGVIVGLDAPLTEPS